MQVNDWPGFMKGEALLEAISVLLILLQSKARVPMSLHTSQTVPPWKA